MSNEGFLGFMRQMYTIKNLKFHNYFQKSSLILENQITRKGKLMVLFDLTRRPQFSKHGVVFILPE